MIGLKQLAGVVAGIVLLASSAMFASDGNDAGVVALETLSSGGTRLSAQAPATLDLQGLRAFEVATDQALTTAPSVVEGALGTVKLVASTQGQPVQLHLGGETITVRPGSTLTIHDFQGTLELTEDGQVAVVDATGVASAVKVVPPAGTRISIVGEPGRGLPARNVVLDGQPIQGSYQALGQFQVVQAQLLGPATTGSDGTSPHQVGLLVGGELFPIHEEQAVVVEDLVGLVATVHLDPNQTYLRLEGFANVTIDGQGLVDDIHLDEAFDQEVNLTDATRNRAPTANFTWRPQAPEAGESVELIDRSRDDKFVHNWTWSVDGSTISSEQHPSHTFLEPGLYNVRLTVHDAQGKEDTVTRAVQVFEVTPDIDVIWIPASPVEDQDITFEADVTHPHGGEIESVDWTFEDGLTHQGSTLTRAFPLEGAYNFTVKAVARGGGTAWHNGTVAIANAPPIPAFHLVPSNPVAGEPVTLVSDAVDHGDGQVVNVTWRIGSGLKTLQGETVNTTIPTDGTIGITMTATDEQGARDSLTKSVEVQNPAPRVEIAHTPAYPNPGEPVTFVAQIQDDDLPQRITWSLPGGVTREGGIINYQFFQGGSHKIGVRVVDGDGAVGRSNKTVQVNHAPTVSLSLSEDVVLTHEPVTLTAEALDPDGNTTTISWTIDGAPGGTGSTIDRSWNDDGEHFVRATAIDENGATARAVGTIIVSNRPPTLNPEVLSATVNRGEPIELRANADDLDGNVTQVSWTVQGSTLATGEQATIVFPSAGLHDLRVTALDDDGSLTNATLQLLVNAPPRIDPKLDTNDPVAGTPITFDANVVDPEGDPVTVTWSFGDGTGTTTGSTVTHTYDLGGRYTVRAVATDDSNATTVWRQAVSVATPELSVGLQVNPTQPLDGDAITFTVDLPSGRQVERIDWSFGDNTRRTTGPGVTSVSHTYDEPREYSVLAIVRADHGSYTHKSTQVRVTGSFAHTVQLVPELPDGQCVNTSSPEVAVRAVNTVTNRIVRLGGTGETWTVNGCELSYTFEPGSWALTDGLVLDGNVGKGLFRQGGHAFQASGLLDLGRLTIADAEIAFESFSVVANPDKQGLLTTSSSNTTFHDPTHRVRLDGMLRWADGSLVANQPVDLEVSHALDLVRVQLDPLTYYHWTTETDANGRLSTHVPMPAAHLDGREGLQDPETLNVAYLPGQYRVSAAATAGFQTDLAQVDFVEDPAGIFAYLGDLDALPEP